MKEEEKVVPSTLPAAFHVATENTALERTELKIHERERETVMADVLIFNWVEAFGKRYSTTYILTSYNTNNSTLLRMRVSNISLSTLLFSHVR